MSPEDLEGGGSLHNWWSYTVELPAKKHCVCWKSRWVQGNVGQCIETTSCSKNPWTENGWELGSVGGFILTRVPVLFYFHGFTLAFSLRITDSGTHFRWKRPPRSQSPTMNPALPCLNKPKPQQYDTFYLRKVSIHAFHKFFHKWRLYRIEVGLFLLH